MIIDELLVKLQFDTKATRESLNKVEGMLSTFPTKIAAILGGFGVTAALQGLVNQFTDVASSIGFISQNLGVSAPEIDKWSQAIARTGDSVASAQGVIKGFSKTLTDALINNSGEAVRVLSNLRVTISRTAQGGIDFGKVLLQLADRFKNLSPPTRNVLGQALGLDEATINLLSKGRAGVEKLLGSVEHYGVVSKRQTELAIKNQRALRDFQQRMRQVALQLGSALLPTAQKIINALGKFADFIANNSKTIVTGLKAIAIALGALFSISLINKIATTIKALSSLFNLFFGSKVKIIVTALTAIGAAIAYLIKDFQEWDKTGNSTFANLWDWLFKISKAFDSMANDVSNAIQDAEKIWDAFIGKIKGTWEELKKTFSGGFFSGIKEIFNTIFGINTKLNVDTSELDKINNTIVQPKLNIKAPQKIKLDAAIIPSFQLPKRSAPPDFSAAFKNDKDIPLGVMMSRNHNVSATGVAQTGAINNTIRNIHNNQINNSTSNNTNKSNITYNVHIHTKGSDTEEIKNAVKRAINPNVAKVQTVNSELIQ